MSVKSMRTLELFAGTKSFSKVAAEHGYSICTVDNDPRLDPNILVDVRKFAWQNFVGTEVLWASPPCQGFSVAVIGRNWNHDYTPKTDSARLAMELAKKTIEVIENTRPRYWFIENPRGMLRKMPFMEEFLKRVGGGTAHRHILPVRRRPHEADGHMDELSGVATKATVQQRSTVSRSSAARVKDGYAGHQGCKGPRAYTRSIIRGDSR